MNSMTENELRLLISNHENTTKRLEIIDSRIANLTEISINLQSVIEQIKSHGLELERVRAALTRAHDRLDKAIEEIGDLKATPAKKTHAAISDAKQRLISALCGILAAGLIGAAVKVITLLMKH